MQEKRKERQKVMGKPLEFKARKVVDDNGKEVLVIDPISEEITYPCGRKDVIVHVPSLELISKFKVIHNIQ